MPGGDHKARDPKGDAHHLRNWPVSDTSKKPRGNVLAKCGHRDEVALTKCTPDRSMQTERATIGRPNYAHVEVGGE